MAKNELKDDITIQCPVGTEEWADVITVLGNMSYESNRSYQCFIKSPIIVLEGDRMLWQGKVFTVTKVTNRKNRRYTDIAVEAIS